MKVGNFGDNSNDKRKLDVIGRDVILKNNDGKFFLWNMLVFGKRKLVIIGNVIYYGKKFFFSLLKMIEYSSNKILLVSSSDKVVGGNGNWMIFNDFVFVVDSNKMIFKIKYDLNESFLIVYCLNVVLKGVVNVLKNNV